MTLPQRFDFDFTDALEEGPSVHRADPRLVEPDVRYETIVWMAKRLTVPLTLRDRHLDDSVPGSKHMRQAVGHSVQVSLFNEDGSGLLLTFPLERWRTSDALRGGVRQSDYSFTIERWSDDLVDIGEQQDRKTPVLMAAEPFNFLPSDDNRGTPGITEPHPSDNDK